MTWMFALRLPWSGACLRQVAAGLFCTVLASTAHGQLFRQPTTAIEHARVVVGDGTIVEDATILVRGGRIVAVGAGIEVPERASRIDATGKTITPGLIDVGGMLGNTSQSGNDATHRAIDAFDRYAWREFESALRQGVTAGFLPARGGAGINGIGAIVRFVPGDGRTFGEFLREEAALCLNLGSDTSPVQRLAAFDGLRKRFAAARTYREALETYEEDLKDYETKLKERAAKAAATGGEKANAGDQPAGGEPPASPPPPTGEEAKPEEANASPEKKEEELKKPQRPERNVANEVLLQALDRQLPVRIMANASEDILNALELASEFGLRVVIIGAAEAGPVAGELAAAEVSIVLSNPVRGGVEPGGIKRPFDATAQALSEAAVDWTVAGGIDDPAASRFLLIAAQAASQSSPGRNAIELATSEAASFLGIADEVGLIAPGRLADLVVWSADPHEPAARVETVYVGGRRAWSMETGASAARESELP